MPQLEKANRINQVCYGSQPKQLNGQPSTNRGADLNFYIGSLVIFEAFQTRILHYFGRRQMKFRMHYSRDVAGSQLRRGCRRARTIWPEAPRTPSNNPPVTFRGNTPIIHILCLGVSIHIYVHSYIYVYTYIYIYSCILYVYSINKYICHDTVLHPTEDEKSTKPFQVYVAGIQAPPTL